MGLQTVPGYIGQSGYNHPPELMRNLNAALAGRRTGAFRHLDFALTPSASAMQMTIAAGDAVIVGGESSTQGGYYVWSNAPETIAWPAAAGLPRYDSLICRVIDTQYGTDASSPQALWEVITGTPAASPSPVSSDSIVLEGGTFHRHGGAWRVADVLVPASVSNLSTATVQNRRRYARLGRHTLGLTADIPTDAQIGDTYSYLDGTFSGQTFRYNGTVWVPDTEPLWQNYTPVVRNNQLSGTPATISSTVDHARYKRVGDIVYYEFATALNAAANNGGSVSLPLASTTRSHHAGNLYAFAGGLTGQVGVAYHSNNPAAPTSWDRLTVVNINTGIQDLASGTVLRGSGFYVMTD